MRAEGDEARRDAVIASAAVFGSFGYERDSYLFWRGILSGVFAYQVGGGLVGDCGVYGAQRGERELSAALSR